MKKKILVAVSLMLLMMTATVLAQSNYGTEHANVHEYSTSVTESGGIEGFTIVSAGWYADSMYWVTSGDEFLGVVAMINAGNHAGFSAEIILRNDIILPAVADIRHRDVRILGNGFAIGSTGANTITVTGGSLTMVNTIVRGNGHGIGAVGTTVTLENVTLENNGTYGIFLGSGAALTMDGGSIRNNERTGIRGLPGVTTISLNNVAVTDNIHCGISVRSQTVVNLSGTNILRNGGNGVTLGDESGTVTLVMVGGELRYNGIDVPGGNPASRGLGIRSVNANITVYHGIIADNFRGGILETGILHSQWDFGVNGGAVSISNNIGSGINATRVDIIR